MPLYPPPKPNTPPTDLVVDRFGTYLGKRSERLVLRWRESVGQSDLGLSTIVPTQTLDSDAGTPSPAPSDSCSSAPTDDSNSSSIDAASTSAPTPTPTVGPASTPTLTPTDIPRPSPTDDPPADADAVGTEPVHQRQVTGSGDNSATTDPTLKSAALPDDAAAKQAASQLLQLWGRQDAPGVLGRLTSRSRLPSQLDECSEPGATNSGTKLWQERHVPFARLRSLTISGRGITVSSDVIEALVERGISISFLSGRGQPVAQLSSPGLGGTVQTRRSQLVAYETALGVDLAVEFIRGKLRNQKHQLQYSGKYLKASDPERFDRLTRKIKALAALRKQLVKFQAERLDSVRDRLMGYEGTGARIYWEGVSILLEGRIEFPGRSTRGAMDPVNSALNYGYGILYSQVSGALVNAGLELYAGFLHVDRPGKPALVLDLVEEFRAPAVDRAILAIVNHGIPLETDAHGLTAATRKLVADRILERLATPVPYEGKRWPLQAIIQNQARHLAVAVRGEREYRAFASRW